MAMGAFFKRHVRGYLLFLIGCALLVSGILAIVAIFMGTVVEGFVAGIVGFDIELWSTVLLALLSFAVSVTGVYILRRA